MHQNFTRNNTILAEMLSSMPVPLPKVGRLSPTKQIVRYAIIRQTETRERLPEAVVNGSLPLMVQRGSIRFNAKVTWPTMPDCIKPKQKYSNSRFVKCKEI
eukprot:GHVT01065685.1.p1 GENE.GHVT01065685.1~~GHVT01065685.1.p1  ORF type:complete len:101 (+),score=4.21 GHVT01065685.1:115-417(+)